MAEKKGIMGFLERTLGFGAGATRRFAVAAVILYVIGLVNGYRLATNGQDLFLQIIVPLILAILAYYSTEVAVIVAFAVFYFIFFIV